MLHSFVTIGTHAGIGEKLAERFGNVVTDIEFSVAVNSDGDNETLRRLARELQADDGAIARRTILGLAA